MIIGLIGNFDLGNQFVGYWEHEIESQRCNPSVFVIQEKSILMIVCFRRNRNIVLKTIDLQDYTTKKLALAIMAFIIDKGHV